MANPGGDVPDPEFATAALLSQQPAGAAVVSPLLQADGVTGTNGFAA